MVGGISRAQAYANDGVGHDWCVIVAHVTEYTNYILFTLLLLLVSKARALAARASAGALAAACCSKLWLLLMRKGCACPT